MTCQIVDETYIDLEEPSDAALAVSAARSLAGEAGFKESDCFLIATAVSELATNIIRYAGRGNVTLRIIRNLTRTGLEVFAKDSGPGIADMEKAMSNNYSTGNGLGLGLPSIKRIMDEFDIQSEVGRGTMVVARKWND